VQFLRSLLLLLRFGTATRVTPILWNFFFRIYASAIKKEQPVDFLATVVSRC